MFSVMSNNYDKLKRGDLTQNYQPVSKNRQDTFPNNIKIIKNIKIGLLKRRLKNIPYYTKFYK